MKIRVTQKQIKDNYKNIIEVGYCDLQYLLTCRDPEYNTSGVYGWNADIYKINYNTVIVTGCRPFGNISNWEIVRKYEAKAEKIRKTATDYKSIEKKLEKLIDKFIAEILEKESK